MQSIDLVEQADIAKCSVRVNIFSVSQMTEVGSRGKYQKPEKLEEYLECKQTSSTGISKLILPVVSSILSAVMQQKLLPIGKDCQMRRNVKFSNAVWLSRDWICLLSYSLHSSFLVVHACHLNSCSFWQSLHCLSNDLP